MKMQERLAQRCNELERRIAALETLEAMMAHIFGWDGSAWRKLPLVFGYSAALYQTELEDTAIAGYNSFLFATVPAGEIWHVQGGAMFDETNNFDRGLWVFTLGPTTYWIDAETPVVQYQAVRIRSPILLPAGAAVTAAFYGCTAGDDIRATVWGYKMLIAE